MPVFGHTTNMRAWIPPSQAGDGSRRMQNVYLNTVLKMIEESAGKVTDHDVFVKIHEERVWDEAIPMIEDEEVMCELCGKEDEDERDQKEDTVNRERKALSPKETSTDNREGQKVTPYGRMGRGCLAMLAIFLP